ncbi:MAG: Tat pathway signal protein, partial [Akkermansiaceae bacterium]|nr:Tat pathway signal protein [Akkermansiaceae bacterium]
MQRRHFIQNTVATAAVAAFTGNLKAAGGAEGASFPVVRTPLEKRKFTSKAVERVISEVRAKIGNKEMGWLFENCFPNTLDTTVDFAMVDGKPDTYVITGDIDAMWLRDSSAQVSPYLSLVKEDEQLKLLIAGVINRQTRCILLDPYANAFYKDQHTEGDWKSDHTDMKPGLHERKWEIDSLCYPIRLAHRYWKETGDTAPFDSQWQDSIKLILKTFKEQQRKENHGPYSFMRTTQWATDTVPGKGYGNPARPVGLIFSMFRPSDDATVFPFLVPSNFFAVVSLREAAEMLEAISKDAETAKACRALADEVEAALKTSAIIDHPTAGKIFA